MTQPTAPRVPLEIRSKQYKRRDMLEHDMRSMMAAGWEVQNTTTTNSRRMVGCLFGIIGYWIMPKRTVFHVTYVRYAAPTTTTPSNTPSEF